MTTFLVLAPVLSNNNPQLFVATLSTNMVIVMIMFREKIYINKKIVEEKKNGEGKIHFLLRRRNRGGKG